MVIYGSLTTDPMRLDLRRLIAARRSVQGFWLGYWMRQRNIPQALKLFRQVGQLISDGVLATETGPTFPMDQVAEAVRQAEVSGKPGKVLLTIS